MSSTSKPTYSRIQPPANDSSPTAQKTGGNVADIYRLFINRTNPHLVWQNSHWSMSKTHLTTDMIRQAIEGQLALAVQAVSGSGTTRFTVLDADDVDTFRQLLPHVIQHPSANLLVEQSRRGGHVWYFWTSSTTWQQAHQFGVSVCEAAGVTCEVYPKHGMTHSIKLPGTVHPKSGVAYPAIDLESGELVSATSLLAAIRPLECPVAIEAVPPTPAPKVTGSPADFEQLVAELGNLTQLRVYGPERASGRCPWHRDTSPSLFVKGRRFHCLSSRCGVFGDVYDVRRFTKDGTRPPRG